MLRMMFLLHDSAKTQNYKGMVRYGWMGGLEWIVFLYVHDRCTLKSFLEYESNVH